MRWWWARGPRVRPPPASWPSPAPAYCCSTAHNSRATSPAPSISPQSTRVLERLGPDVVAAVEAAAPAHLYGMRLVAPSGRVAVGRFAATHGWHPPRPYGFALPRPVFDTILRDAAVRAGVESGEGAT